MFKISTKFCNVYIVAQQMKALVTIYVTDFM